MQYSAMTLYFSQMIFITITITVSYQLHFI